VGSAELQLLHDSLWSSSCSHLLVSFAPNRRLDQERRRCEYSRSGYRCRAERTIRPAIIRRQARSDGMGPCREVPQGTAGAFARSTRYIVIHHALGFHSCRAVPVVKSKIPAPLRRIQPLLLAARRHTVQCLHVGIAEADHTEVVGDPGLGHRLWQDDNAPVDLVGYQNSRDGNPVRVGDGFEIGIGQERRVYGATSARSLHWKGEGFTG